MKKGIAGTLTALLLCMALAGCGEGGPSSLSVPPTGAESSSVEQGPNIELSDEEILETYIGPLWRAGLLYRCKWSAADLSPSEIVRSFARAELWYTDWWPTDPTNSGKYRYEEESHSVWVPASDVEEYLTARFDITAEELRKSETRIGDERRTNYNEKEGMYCFTADGLGSLFYPPMIERVERDGVYLTVHCKVPEVPELSPTVVLKAIDGRYVYDACYDPVLTEEN